MTVRSWPFDTDPVTGAPQESFEDDMSRLFRLFALDGVADGMGVTAASDGSGVDVGVGFAVVQGFGCAVEDTPERVAVDPNTNTTQDRVDRVVLRLDRAGNTLKPVWLQGAPSGAPQPPALTRTASIYDVKLARFTRLRGGGGITGIVSEAVSVGGEVIECETTADVDTSQRSTILARERSTGRVMLWDGSAWRVIYEDTGWVLQSYPGPPTVHWTASNGPWLKRKNGVGSIRATLTRAVDPLPSGAHDSPLIFIPPEFSPVGDHYKAIPVEGHPDMGLYIWGNGEHFSELRGITEDVKVGESVYLYVSWPVD